MTPDTKRRVDQIFEEVSLLPPGEREGRLLQVEPRLAAEVRHLLALLPSAERLFADLEQRLEPGRRIGAWRLTALLGRGGMGEVWRAERADGEYQARVAIKFLGNLAIAGGWDRFQREKQFLANLKHPGIAKMIDAGTTAAGVPWLAMELVDGVPITQFAAQVGLRERVQLIIRLCEAIEYAHQKLIVHRDLKPPNILVTSRGNPKLLDFGIALDLDRTESITTPLTRMVSIEWASPEQLRDEPVSTATDVFSLGRILCAVLAGRTGLEDKKGRALWDAVIHSAHPSPSQLSGDRRLEGDLDSIVLRATTAKPEDRYRSVSELRQDLENWIALRPVRARRWTRGYLARRFLQRHRIPVTVTAAVACILVASTASVRQASLKAMSEQEKAVASEQIARKREQEAIDARGRAEAARAESERQRAAAEAAQRSATQRFDEAWKLARAVIFDYQKQLQAAGVGASLRAQMVNDSILLLDRLGQETIPAGYKLEVARAYVEMAMATGVRAAGNVGDQSLGRRALAKAEFLLRQYLKDHPGNREASRRLADVLVLTSDLGQVKFWKEASSILARLEREDANDRDTLWSLGNLHFWMAAAERTREAKVIQFEKSLDYFDRARKLDPTNLERLSAVSLLHKQLGNEYTYLQDVEKTCFHGAEAVRLDEIRLKERPDSVRVHMDLNTSQGILADCARFRGGDTAFLSAYRPVLEGRRRLFQKDPSNTHYRNRLATALVRGANALRAAGQLHDALAMIEEGMRLGDEIMREDLLWQRAATHRQLGSTAEACATFDTLRSLSLKQLERWKKTAEALNKLCPSR